MISLLTLQRYVIHDLLYLEPSEAPSSVWARAASASEIEVYWKPIPPRSSSGTILAYEVRKMLKKLK